MPVIEFRIQSTPSRSKGWASWTATAGPYGVMDTTTGTQTGSGRVGDERKTIHLSPGTRVAIQIKCLLIEGRAKTRTTYTHDAELIVREGAECEVDYFPGSQGLSLRVRNAELLTVHEATSTMVDEDGIPLSDYTDHPDLFND